VDILAFSVVKSVMGKPSIIARPVSVCDLTLEVSKESALLGRPTWFLRAQTVPRKLVIQNGNNLRWRYVGIYHRRGKGTLSWVARWSIPDSAYMVSEEPVEVWYEPLPEDWVSDQVSDWEVEISIKLGGQKKQLFKGHPTSLQVIK